MTISSPPTPCKATDSSTSKHNVRNNPPWIKTPCLASESLSAAAGCQVFAKLDLLQPSGSFKIRGVGNMVWQTVRAFGGERPLHFYSSSRGNAGLAAATAAKRLGQTATVVVPEMTEPRMLARITAAGAEVLVHGVELAEADECARALAAAREDAAYVPPFDHELIWEGESERVVFFLFGFTYHLFQFSWRLHAMGISWGVPLRQLHVGNSSIIDEIFEDWEGPPPDAIVCSVGGGGLLNGIMLGLDAHGWGDEVAVLALETEGADCLARSLQAGSQVTMPEITSIAKSLGASRVSTRTWDLVQQRSNIRSVVLRDADAARACVRFAEEGKMIVEPACGVSLALLYEDLLADLMPGFGPESRVVVIVCGGRKS